MGAFAAGSRVGWMCSSCLIRVNAVGGRKLYSSAAVKEKPYYITSPIFYVNAGLFSCLLVMMFNGTNCH